MSQIYKKKSSLSRIIDHKTWECLPYPFERQPGKKKDTNDYFKFKSCILGQKAGSLTSERSPQKSGWGLHLLIFRDKFLLEMKITERK